MPHPNGSQGKARLVLHTFDQVLAFVRQIQGKCSFQSSTGENMIATIGTARDGRTPLVVLKGERNVHGRVCEACWGYSSSCTGERVGQAIIPLDQMVS